MTFSWNMSKFKVEHQNLFYPSINCCIRNFCWCYYVMMNHFYKSVQKFLFILLSYFTFCTSYLETLLEVLLNFGRAQNCGHLLSHLLHFSTNRTKQCTLPIMSGRLHTNNICCYSLIIDTWYKAIYTKLLLTILCCDLSLCKNSIFVYWSVLHW